MQQSLSKWLPAYTAVLENRPSTSVSGDFDPVEVCPLLYTTRIATSKVLIELEEWNSATQVENFEYGKCVVIRRRLCWEFPPLWGRGKSNINGIESINYFFKLFAGVGWND